MNDMTSLHEMTKVTEGTLIASGKVKDTDVYSLSGDKLGKIEDVMLDKVSGRAIYAILSFGGFLGIGHDHYPLPWSQLKYSVDNGGYVIDLDKDRLTGAPKYAPNQEFRWTADYGRDVDRFYNAPSIWL